MHPTGDTLIYDGDFRRGLLYGIAFSVPLWAGIFALAWWLT